MPLSAQEQFLKALGDASNPEKALQLTVQQLVEYGYQGGYLALTLHGLLGNMQQDKEYEKAILVKILDGLTGWYSATAEIKDAAVKQLEVSILNTPDPEHSLTNKVAEFVSHGYKREFIVLALEELRATLRQKTMEQEEDVVMDAMDRLTGWHSPDNAL